MMIGNNQTNKTQSTIFSQLLYGMQLKAQIYFYTYALSIHIITASLFGLDMHTVSGKTNLFIGFWWFTIIDLTLKMHYNW